MFCVMSLCLGEKRSFLTQFSWIFFFLPEFDLRIQKKILSIFLFLFVSRQKDIEHLKALNKCTI